MKVNVKGRKFCSTSGERPTTAPAGRMGCRVDAVAGDRGLDLPEGAIEDGEVPVQEKQHLASLDAWRRVMAMVVEEAAARRRRRRRKVETAKIENTPHEEKKDEGGSRNPSFIVGHPSENSSVKEMNTKHHLDAFDKDIDGMPPGSTESYVIENRFGARRGRAAAAAVASGKALGFLESGRRKSSPVVGTAAAAATASSSSSRETLITTAIATAKATARGTSGPSAKASAGTAASTGSRGTQPLSDTITRTFETIGRPTKCPKSSPNPLQESTKDARIPQQFDADQHNPVDSGAAAEKWSAQFRDDTTPESNARRDVLLQMLLSPKHIAAGPGLSSTKDAGSIKRTGETGGGLVYRRTVSNSVRALRQRETQMGATLRDFKTSIGFSAKGDLFDDLFGKPSCLDEALVAEPGQRTRTQASRTVWMNLANI